MTETIIFNEEVVRQLYANALNQRDFKLLADFIADEFVGVRGLQGAAGFEEPVKNLIQAFPDIQWHIYDIVSDEQKVAVRWIWKGTHKEQYQQFPPTGKSFYNEGLGVFEFKDGKIISAKLLTDRLGFLQQMEAVPLDLNVLPAKNTTGQHVGFIDKFFVPKASVEEFSAQMNLNRTFVNTQPGLLKSERYDQLDEHGNLSIITVAVWQNHEFLDKAKGAVQAEFKRTGFDPQDFYKRLNIKLERGIYTAASE